MSKRTHVLTHLSAGDAQHIVAAQLRVLIVPDEEGLGYVAQGLEIDYVATGHTLEEVKANFAEGLLRTVEAYLHRDRPLSALFSKGRTPPEAWQQWLKSERKDMLNCATLVDLRGRLPEGTPFFEALAFRQPEVEPARAS